MSLNKRDGTAIFEKNELDFMFVIDSTGLNDILNLDLCILNNKKLELVVFIDVMTTLSNIYKRFSTEFKG